MEADDESFPKQFLLTTDQEHLPLSVNRRRKDENSSTRASHQCSLCRKIPDDPVFTCAACINSGQFCSSKHAACSHPPRNALLALLDKNTREEFQQHSNNKSLHLLCFERRFFLTKLNLEKTKLQTQLQTGIESSEELYRTSEELRQRRERLKRIHRSIERLKEQIEQKKQLHRDSQKRMCASRSRIEVIEKKLNQIKLVLRASNTEVRTKIDLRTKQEMKLNNIRQEYLEELNRFLFPIQRAYAIEEKLAMSREALLSAQQTTGDEINIGSIKTDEATIVYQIVHSCLPRNGNYQIENLPLTVNPDSVASDLDSPQPSISRDFYEVLSALSHGCQLTNVIAFILDHHLPFRLHHLEFNTDSLTVDCLRANIAKLNANILSCCLSQGIPVEFDNVTYTLENLAKLVNFERYCTRPKAISYPQKYIDTIEGEVNEISRTLISDYWFDDDDENGDTDGADSLNNYEWEAILQNDPSIYEYDESLPSISSQSQSSLMNTSIDYLKTKSSGLFNSIIRNFKP